MHSLFKIINFAVFVGILYYFLRKPIRRFWRSRRSGISDAISAAEEAYNKALSSKMLAEKREKGIEGEIAKLRGQFLKEGRYKKDLLIGSAKTLGDKMVRDAKMVIEYEAKKVSVQLREFAAEKAIRLAEERLVKEMGLEAKAKLLATAQREIESGI